MLRPVKYIPLFLFFISSVFAQVIHEFNITGNNEFDKDNYSKWSGIIIGEKTYPGLLDSVKIRIATELADRGYLNSKFDSSGIVPVPDSQNITVNIAITEGDPTYINHFVYSGADSLDTLKIIPLFDFLEGEILNKNDIEQALSSSLDYYEDSGNPFARIIVKSVYVYYDSLKDESLADLHLDFDKGKKRTIDKIEILGNSTTRDYVITRELRINKGEEYSQAKIDELPKRLNRLRFFDPVEPPQYYVNEKGEGVLSIKVKEKQTNNFDGIIGYIPGTKQNEKGYFTGLVNISMLNLFGTGRAAAVRWQQFDRYSQEMELKYLEPWLFGYPFNINGDFYQRKQDSSFVQRKLEGGIEYLATEDISASVIVSTEQVIPTIKVVPVFTVFNSSAFTTGLNLKFDNRDDPYSPTEGFYFLTSYSFSRKKIFGPTEFITPSVQTNVNLQRVTLDLTGFYKLFNRQVIALGVHGKELRGAFFEESDLFRLGGTNTLRGYRENQFLGSRIGWTNLEYRLLLTRRTFAFLFFDTGYFYRKPEPERNILEQEGFKTGYGIGMNIETGVGVLSVSFALAQGDSFTDGKIHFGIINEF
jgi:outer membrane protein assembly factor BamA